MTAKVLRVGLPFDGSLRWSLLGAELGLAALVHVSGFRYRDALNSLGLKTYYWNRQENSSAISYFPPSKTHLFFSLSLKKKKKKST